MVRFSARVAGRRARSAETLLAARALEADARPWGRTLSVVSLAVTVGSVTGWFQAEMLSEGRATETFWLSSFILLDLTLLVGMAVASSALFVHRAEYLLEHGPVLATLRATGTSEAELRRVLVRQALIASAPVCTVAALTGVIAPSMLALGAPAQFGAWLLYPFPRAALLAGLGVLAAVLAALFSRRRLRRTVTPVLLRTE
jgi:predicted lysophospholipase L1 biosynthesis ABC-type transport system permease subunit